MRVDLHHSQRAAQRIKQAPAKAQAHGMLAAQANHQLPRARGCCDGRCNRIDRRSDVVGQLNRRQRMHTVDHRRLAIHLATATTGCPTLAGKHVTMHTLRHTAAMRFLHAGIDTSVIALWLGHEQIATTGIYLHADLTIKQQALDRTRPPEVPTGRYQPDDALLAWLTNL